MVWRWTGEAESPYWSLLKTLTAAAVRHMLQPLAESELSLHVWHSGFSIWLLHPLSMEVQ